MKRILLTFAFVVCAFGMAQAQGIKNVRINEVLVVPGEQSYEDDYGHRSAWIELYNSGYEVVNVGQCWLQVTRTDGSKTRYQIPKDPATAMRSQTYLVFFCEGTDTKGTFYTNFTLDGVTRIELLNANGKDVLSVFPIDPAAQRPNITLARLGEGTFAGGNEPAPVASERSTPGATNETTSGPSKGEEFRERDQSGGVMAIIAMSVVFSALVLIFFVLKLFGAAMQRMHVRKTAAAEAASAAGVATAAAPARKKPASVQVEEEMAAIALALKMHQEEQHILEATVITINRASRVYSPWSSKIHGIPSSTPKR